MTAIRNSMLAFGLMYLTFAAQGTAQEYGQGGEATCEAGCGDCQSGCQGGCGSFSGFTPENFCHEQGCDYAGEAHCVEHGMLYRKFEPEWDDLCQRCNSCTWRVEGSAIYLHRGNPTSTNLLINPDSGASILNAGDMGFPYRAGPRVGFCVMDCAGWGVDAHFFFVDGWSASRDFASSDLPGGFANLVVDSVIQTPVTDAHVDLASMFYSTEVNLRKNLFGGIDLVTGFRWIDMHDRYSAHGTSLIDEDTVSETINTRNHLFGWQTGLDGTIFCCEDCWRLSGYIKGAGMLNNATASTNYSDPGSEGGSNLSASDTQCHVAFFGEAGLTLYVKIDKHVSVSGGYQAVYVSDVAQPVNQLAQTNLVGGTSLINVGSDVFYHGANLGLEVAW